MDGEVIFVRGYPEAQQITEILSCFGMIGWSRVKGQMIAYREGDLILGCAAIAYGESNHTLNCVAVRKGYHRRGIGSRLIREIISRLPNGHEVWLETMFWNRRFYESLGFDFIPIKRVIEEFGLDPRGQTNTMVMVFRNRS